MSARCLDRALLVAFVAVAPLGMALAAGEGPRVPTYDVKKSCRSAKEVSKDFQTDDDYQSCLADETNARKQLGKVWPSYSARQRRECLEPGPDKSYVETLTCLEMDTTAGSGSDVGGPVAPGLKFK